MWSLRGFGFARANVCKSHCSRPQYCATLHSILCIYTYTAVYAAVYNVVTIL